MSGLLLGLSLVWTGTSASELRPAPAATALPVATQALIAALGRPAPARTAFAEARFMRMLDRPLVVSGELAWLGGDRLQRRVEQPRAETTSIADGAVTQQRDGKSPRQFSLKRAPQLQVLLDSFVALLSGDAARLDQAFAMHQEGDGAGAWTLTLTPRDAQVAKAVASIVIDGHAGDSRCMQLHEADGDLAVDLLGPLAARMPARPTREALQALCRGTR
ncbi:MAG TPA: LolA-related protein [Rhodanobacter sp.]|nr:LolA-related protein [Rhodanobacter sp.]